MEHQTSVAADTAKDTLREIADATSEKLQGTAATAQEVVGNVADQALQYGEQARDLAAQLTDSLQKSAKENPLQTLAGIVALGFVLGAIWKK